MMCNPTKNDEERKKIARRVSSFLSEHFQCCVLVGFGFDGSRYMSKIFDNFMQESALQQGLEDVLQEEFQLAQKVLVLPPLGEGGSDG